MKLKAKDTLFVSSVSSENIPPNGVFEVSDDAGKELIDRGYAVEVKAEKAAPENKMEAAPVNKAKPPLSALSVSAKSKKGKK